MLEIFRSPKSKLYKNFRNTKIKNFTYSIYYEKYVPYEICKQMNMVVLRSIIKHMDYIFKVLKIKIN